MSSYPKVMHVLASGSDGGAENACADIVDALHDARLPQHIVLRGHEGRVKRLHEKSIPHDVLPFGGDLDIFSSWKLKKIIEREKPDIIQTWLSRAARKLPNKKSEAPIYVSRLGGYYKLKNYAKTDYFVANTPDIRKYLIAQGKDSEHVTYIPNYAAPDLKAKAQARRDLNTRKDDFVFLSLSRLHTEKGIDTFLLGLSEVPNAVAWIAGTGPQEVELKALAVTLGIADRVRFLGWRNDVSSLLNAVDGFVLASRLEPFGNAFLNAWAHRVPVIASASQGPSQFIDDGEDGLIFQIDDPHAMAKHMKNIMSDAEKRKHLAEHGFARFEHEFSKEKCVKAYLDFYTSIYARQVQGSIPQ